MPLAARIEVWDGGICDYATILKYNCHRCGREWERDDEKLKPMRML